jgi:hypothetical protein
LGGYISKENKIMTLEPKPTGQLAKSIRLATKFAKFRGSEFITMSDLWLFELYSHEYYKSRTGLTHEQCLEYVGATQEQFTAFLKSLPTINLERLDDAIDEIQSGINADRK